MPSLRRTKSLVCAAACVAAAGAWFFASVARCGADDAADVRPAAVAGAFYPASAGALRSAVQGYLKAASPAVPHDVPDGMPRALIVPHAGYMFSGATAAFAYKLLEGKKAPSRIILIGPSHHAALVGACSVADFSAFATPLGNVPLDADACAQLLKSEPFRAARRPHGPEHCLEVQLPFLQVLWPTPPRIVPVLVGELSAEQCRTAAAGISGILDDDSLIIVSTDFTHYGPRFGFAPFTGVHGTELAAKIRALDMGAVKGIETLKPTEFRDYVGRTGATICGRFGVNVALELFSQSHSSRGVFLRWANSGQVTGDYEDCVSYVAAAVYAPKAALEEARKALAQQVVAAAEPPRADADTGAPKLADDDKRMLLRVARQGIAAAVAHGGPVDWKGPPVDTKEMSATLRVNGGAFVTLRKDGGLRGCIGSIRSDRPLWVTVREMAVAAAVDDPRFKPVGKDELPAITIEVSALGPVRRIRGVEDIQVGRDGLIVNAGYAQGVLLPQVATEQGWGSRRFLEETCRKAGLPADAWQWDGVRLYAFGATVFGETDLKEE